MTSKRTALAGVVALVLAAGSLSGCFGGDDCERSSLGASFERPGPGGGSGGRGGARGGSRGGKGSKSKPKQPGGAVPAKHVDDDCDDD